MQVTIDANGVEELTYEMDMLPRKNEIVRLKDDVYNVVEVIWRETDEASRLEPVVELHWSSLEEQALIANTTPVT